MVVKDAVRLAYQDSFIENYEKWQQVLASFNKVLSGIYAYQWNEAVLREDIQNLPYSIDRVKYDEFCELFLELMSENIYQEDTEELFYAMIERKLHYFYQKFIV